MKNRKKSPLLIAYLVAIAVWIFLFLASTVLTVWYTANGKTYNGQIPVEQLTLVGLVEQKPNEEIPQGDWLVSSDSDPQIHWSCDGIYLDAVELKMQTLWPTGAVVLYYRTVGQADFSPNQMVYAQMTSQGTYRFDLGGKMVEQIRIDPASSGGVILQIEGLSLHTGEVSKLVPDFQQLALLLGLPPIAVAIWNIGKDSVKNRKKSKE